MQTPEELVEKITKEEQSLDAKLHNLEYFMMSEDFIKVSPEQKTLLEQQHKVMTEYKLILIKRAHRINWEAGRGKAAAEPKEEESEQKPDLAIPGLRHCFNCKHHKIEEYPDGHKMHICDSKLLCADKNCWEEQDGTSLDK